VFVPIGIASKAAGLDPGIVFGMNAVAIVPLAGLLSHATESVAKRMGDTIGALMNVTFGNAVELIILYVPASIQLGLANVLLACMSTSAEIKTRKREKPS
jgi:Ca2+:H+ antiporter